MQMEQAGEREQSSWKKGELELGWGAPVCAERYGERDCCLSGGSFDVCYAVKPLDHGLHEATFQDFWVGVEMLVVETGAKTEAA